MGPLEELKLPEWNSESYLNSWMASTPLTAPEGDRQFTTAGNAINAVVPQNDTAIPSLSSSHADSTSSLSEHDDQSAPSDLYDLLSNSSSYSNYTWSDETDSGYTTAPSPPTPPPPQSPPVLIEETSIAAQPVPPNHPPPLVSPPPPPQRSIPQVGANDNMYTDHHHNMGQIPGTDSHTRSDNVVITNSTEIDQTQDILRNESPINYVTNPAYSTNAEQNQFAANVAVWRMVQRRRNPSVNVDINNAPPMENPHLYYVSLRGWRNNSPEATALAIHLCEVHGAPCDISYRTHGSDDTTFFAGFTTIDESLNCALFFPRLVAGRYIEVRIADTCFLPATFLP